MKTLQAIDRALTRVEGWLVILFLSAMILLAFSQVVLRNVFRSGLVWGDVVLRHLVLWMGFLGAALAASQNRHINIDAFTRFLSERTRSAISVLTSLFAALICGILFRASLTFLSYEIADNHTFYGEIPSWYVQVIIPAGFLLLVFHFFVRAAVNAAQAVKGGDAA